MKKLTITMVADPMILLWQTWPTMRKLQANFEEQLEINILPSVLVKDVYNFVDANVLAKHGKKVAVNQYWSELMQIYLQEQEIADMPIYMGSNKQLFDVNHTSSAPLVRGLLAIAWGDKDLEMKVLYQMQYDTLIKNKQTNGMEYLSQLATKYGVDKQVFTTRYESEALTLKIEENEKLLQAMNLNRLPGYIITYDEKSYALQGLLNYDQWLKVIKEITNGTIKSNQPRIKLADFIEKYQHISSLELKYAFNLTDENQVFTEVNQMKNIRQKAIKGHVFFRYNK